MAKSSTHNSLVCIHVQPVFTPAKAIIIMVSIQSALHAFNTDFLFDGINGKSVLNACGVDCIIVIIWAYEQESNTSVHLYCTDGVECPIGLLWTSSNGNLSLTGRERIYTLEELDEARCAARLNLSKELFMREGCPLTFQWRGKIDNLPICYMCKYILQN